MKQSLISTAALMLLAALAIILYLPALDSGFFLDDHYNLTGLDQIDAKGMAHYAFTGFSGSLGRPLSLLSFALQHESWPDLPEAFKWVNLLIHLAVGLLIFFIARLLARYAGFARKEALALALICSTLWLLHPMHVSTVLYVVQRMTQLSALFTLLGFLGYLYSRNRFNQGETFTGLLGMSMAVGAGTVLGVLSKENAILLPLFILITEATLLHRCPRPALWRMWAWIFLALPLILLAGYLAYGFEGVLAGYEHRPFTLGERLLTECVVLLTYLSNLIFPHSSAFGLYHDDFPISRNLLSPPVTAFAVATVVGMIGLAWALRKRLPVISFAILWFFAGHVLESSFIGLEIYFEHRNYLPSLGPMFLLAWLAIMAWRHMERKQLLAGLATMYACLLAAVTLLVLVGWGHPLLQATEWAKAHPTSQRAHDHLGHIYLRYGQVDKAGAVFDKMTRLFPGDLYPHIKEVSIQVCLRDKPVSDAQWNALREMAARAEWQGYAPVAEFDSISVAVLKGRCPPMDNRNLISVITILAENPNFKSQASNLYEVATDFYLAIEDHESALRTVRHAYALQKRISLLLLEMRILYAINRVDDAKATFQQFSDKAGSDLKYSVLYRQVIEKWARRLYPDVVRAKGIDL